MARWNGATWQPVGSGLSSGTVRALAVVGADLVAGGAFPWSTATVKSGLSRWNGSVWTDFGTLPGAESNEVRALAVSGGTLYAGGSFSGVDGVAGTRNVAAWNGSTWSAAGAGFDDGAVNALAVDGANLYAGGSFTAAASAPMTGLARWDGTSWQGVGGGTNGAVRAILPAGGSLRIGGDFTQAGGTVRIRTAEWTGTEWKDAMFLNPGRGVSGAVLASVDGGSVIYAGGSFTAAGGAAANHVAAWNKATGGWTALGAGLDGTVRALAILNGELYAGGDFTRSGGLLVGNIAKWTGTQWVMVGGGISSSSVAELLAVGTDLYAGGKFTEAGGVPAANIARWDGSAWNALGLGIEPAGGTAMTVSALAADGTDLYVGGVFSKAGSTPVKNVAKWNGSTWSTLGGGLGSGHADSINALAVYDGKVYAGGTFYGNIYQYSLAWWDGTSWSLDNPSAAVVHAMTTAGTKLYIGGRLPTNGSQSGVNDPTTYVRVIGGTSPLNLAGTPFPGTPGTVHALTPYAGSVFVGGTFFRAGTAASQNVAVYGDPLPLPPGLLLKAATITGPDAVTLAADVNANGLSTSVVIEYGPDASYGSQVSAGPAGFSGTVTQQVTAELSGLVPRQLYHYRVRATNAAGETVGADQTVRVCTPLEAWRYRHFGTFDGTGPAGDLADPAEDGVANLLKYATGNHPHRKLPSIFRTRKSDGIGETTGGGTGYGDLLEFSFNRIGDPSLTYIVEAADDLHAESWTQIWSSTGGRNIPGQVAVKDVKLMNAWPRRFMRLQILK